ncbi:MAG: radical SAM protein [Dehalococcoidia bacterium]|nr:MAG: radical SAM protein [Dehalococcoidia bacterium]
MFDVKRMFEVVNIEHVWLFFTDRCNLNCDYCFFQYRSNKRTLSFEMIKKLIDTLSVDKHYNFVVSGGEPLVEWQTARKVIDYVRKKFPHCPVIIQTNGTLLNEEIAAYLKSNSVCVEHGIDGKFIANQRHRKGISKENFKKVLESIELVLRMGVRVNPTMAIHPDEVNDIYDNFKFLVSLGLYSMDVHPVVLEKWEKKHIPVFKREYLKIIKEDAKKGHMLICKDYNAPKEFRFDLVVMPDGNILPNWVFLTRPPQIKQDYYILKIEKDGVYAYADTLKFFLKTYNKFYKKPHATYREFSNLNVEIFLKDNPNAVLSRHFDNYKRICDITKKIDQNVLSKDRL